ncbi:MAG: GNAT family N-acetyltransferase [Planctomycetes bacterium]|nr:GNAT family N-acetyltransferase [Planctomycetota bacterium]
MTAAAAISFRQFLETDIPFGMRLKSIAGWNQLPEDWKRFLAHDPDGCFLGVERSGEPVGTVTTTTYGKRFGWIGMVLVHPEHRRKGIGTCLLNHAMTHLEGLQVACIRLDATPLGKKLYDTLGFQDEYELERREGIGRSCTFEGVEPMRPDDLARVCAYDAPRFGAERARMLEFLYQQSAGTAKILRDETRALRGYLMARPGDHAWQIGPWMAEDAEAADQLLRSGLAALAGKPVFLDVLRQLTPAAEMLEAFSFRVQRPFIRMYRGRHDFTGEPEKTFAIAGVETG